MVRAAASSGDNVQLAWQASGIAGVQVCMAGAACGEDPPCVKCRFAWQAQYCLWGTFVIATGCVRCHVAVVIRDHSCIFGPFCVAARVLGDVAACIPESTPPTIFYTFHQYAELHSTLHTLHCTVGSPHPQAKLYNLHFTVHVYTPHFTLCTPHSTLYTLHFTLYTSHSTLYTSHFTLGFKIHTLKLHPLFPLHFPLYAFHSALYTLRLTLHTLHSALNTIDFAPHTLPCTLYTKLHTLHTLHLNFTLRNL